MIHYLESLPRNPVVEWGKPTLHYRQHLHDYLGHPALVISEVESDTVYIEIHVYRPTMDDPYLKFYTVGVSTLPVHYPSTTGIFSDALDSRYMELMMALPANWPLSKSALQDEKNLWPIRLLKSIGRLPHKTRSPVYGSSLILATRDEKPFSETHPATGCLLRGLRRHEDFTPIAMGDAVCEVFYPSLLHPKEVAVFKEMGEGALDDQWEESDHDEMSDFTRRPPSHNW